MVLARRFARRVMDPYYNAGSNKNTGSMAATNFTRMSGRASQLTYNNDNDEEASEQSDNDRGDQPVSCVTRLISAVCRRNKRQKLTKHAAAAPVAVILPNGNSVVDVVLYSKLGITTDENYAEHAFRRIGENQQITQLLHAADNGDHDNAENHTTSRPSGRSLAVTSGKLPVYLREKEAVDAAGCRQKRRFGIGAVKGPDIKSVVDNADEVYAADAERATAEELSDADVDADEFPSADAVQDACRYPACDKSFTSLKRLKSHVRIQHPSDSLTEFVCEVCGKLFNRRRYLKDHSLAHANMPEFGCDICGKQFTVPNYLHAHRRTHTDEDIFECDICRKKVVSKRSFRQHLRIHSDEKPFACEICAKTFRHLSQLKLHAVVHLPPEQRPCQPPSQRSCACDICGKVFERISSMRRHRESHSANAPQIACDICGKLFKTKRNLRMHKRTHLPEEDKPYECDQCGMRFVRKYALDAHLTTHSELKPYQCDMCHRAFGIKSHLNFHRKTAHSDESYECEQCGKIFSTKWNLAAHEVRHATAQSDNRPTDVVSNKPFECEICGKKLASKRRLRDHANIHLDLKPYECEICKKLFSAKRNLKTHLLIHSGASAAVECDICGRPFLTLRHMRSHRRCHSGVPGQRPGDRLWKCSECGKVLKSKENMQKHELAHTGQKLFECELCGKKLTSKAYLAKHKLTQHPTEEKVESRLRKKNNVEHDESDSDKQLEKNDGFPIVDGGLYQLASVL